MTSVPPPPPPPPPAPAGTATPWYKANGMPLILGIVAVAAVAIPAYLLFFSGDDEPVASGSSTTTTTIAGASTTNATTTTSSASSTTAAGSTTTAAATTTTAGASTTTAGGTTTTATLPPTAQLDPLLAPNYGSGPLATGFLPDPASQVITSGGPIDVSYLGGTCVGWATAAPDVEIQWTSGGTSLRFYFVADTAGEDTVLVINDPDGTWWCVDDSYATSNPTIDFATGPTGTYDIWVASYVSETFVAGTLYITEADANHP